MDNILTEVIAQWGSFGILIAFAIWIIYNQIKNNIDKGKDKGSDKSSGSDNIGNSLLLTTLITNISNKVDKIDGRIDNLENNFNQRINNIEIRLRNQPQNIFEHIDRMHTERQEEHNKMMEDQMRLGPELHKILANYRLKANCDHMFLGSFHNGTTNISGIPYCKFDIIAEKFNPDNVERDIEFAFMYKDADILRHDKLPITLLQQGMVHYIINPDGTSELSEIDDIIYRRMIGRDIKQLILHITRDGNGKPSGFVGGVRYDYNDINTDSMKDCAKELEIIYKNRD